MTPHHMIGFADGENLVLRFQDMVKNGHTPLPDVVYERDTYVWHPRITNLYYADIARISYYQTVIGDTNRIDQVSEKISNTKYDYEYSPNDPNSGAGTLRPRLFKKETKSLKTKSVDINLTIDMLRHAADPQFDVLFLLSGDGDYLPLVEEISKKGKQVWLAAFSKGLNKRLRFAADEFIDLDEIFFKPQVNNLIVPQ